MGQTYAVEAKISFKDPDKFCEIIRNEVEKLNLKDADTSTPFGCFKAITKHDAVIDPFGCWVAYFDGSYSWEGVLLDTFEAVTPALDDGSVIKVYPDSGWWEIKVANGEAVFTSHDESY